MINELPQHIRTNKQVVCGLMFTKTKPDMTAFLDKFVDLINECSISFIEVNGEHHVKLYVISCCVDSSARAPVQGLTQYNGKYGCNWCLHPGEYHGIMKFPLRSELAELRTQSETVRLMFQVDQNNPIFEIKYPSPLINFPKFDIIEGFTPDYVHMALEGVAKQFISYHVDTLKDDEIEVLDRKIDAITIPEQATRYSRQLSCRKHWKAREYENFVLLAI